MHLFATMTSAEAVTEAVDEVSRASAAHEGACQHGSSTVDSTTCSLLHTCLQAELELHGVLYSVSVLVHGDELLIVRIEDRDSLDTWHGEFAAKCEQATAVAAHAWVLVHS